jgi:hypothetical protein
MANPMPTQAPAAPPPFSSSPSSLEAFGFLQPDPLSLVGQYPVNEGSSNKRATFSSLLFLANLSFRRAPVVPSSYRVTLMSAFLLRDNCANLRLLIAHVLSSSQLPAEFISVMTVAVFNSFETHSLDLWENSLKPRYLPVFVDAVHRETFLAHGLVLPFPKPDISFIPGILLRLRQGKLRTLSALLPVHSVFNYLLSNFPRALTKAHLDLIAEVCVLSFSTFKSELEQGTFMAEDESNLLLARMEASIKAIQPKCAIDLFGPLRECKQLSLQFYQNKASRKG